MADIQSLYNELYSLRFPGGISSEDIAIHAYITADAACNIKRILGFYFNDEELIVSDIKIEDGSVQHLDHLIQILVELREYKKRHDELAKLLLDALNSCE